MSEVDLEIERQWEEFREKFDPKDIEAISDNELKDTIQKDLENVAKMTVGEYTLYQKWEEVTNRYVSEAMTVFGEKERFYREPELRKSVNEVKKNIWRPNSIEDYENLKPVLIYTYDSGSVTQNDVFGGTSEMDKTRTKDLSEKWNILRTFTSTMKNALNIGRNLYFMVVDEKTGKYLGVITISSDFIDLTARDAWIGWDRELKTYQKINHTAIGSSIVPTQPLGFNYVGGKLLALLCLSDTVQNLWQERYGEKLVGVTTTSIYGKTKAGGLSQYDNLKYWKKMGYSNGSVSYQTSKKTEKLIKAWLHKNHTRKYFEWFRAKKSNGAVYKRDPRNRATTFVYKKLGIPSELISTAHQRGIYFSPLYENTKEFLCGKIEEDALRKSFDTSEEALTNLWKKKYASKRIKSLVKNDRVSDETLFYDDLVEMDWPETKEKYLKEVGR